MDRSISVTTPESIAFSYDLAGLGSRFLAVWIDLLIQIAILVAIAVGLMLAARGAAAGPARAPAWAESFAIAFFAAVIFIVFFGYFILFEALRGGRTPGKQIVGIRVVRDGGYPLDFGSSLVRNLVRVAEVAFGFYAVSAVAALLSKQNKRLGDMAAGTIVVRDERVASLAVLREEAGAGPRPALLTAEEYAIVDRFVSRRAGLEPGVRGLLAARIADRLRPRLSADLQKLDDEDLLSRLGAS